MVGRWHLLQLETEASLPAYIPTIHSSRSIYSTRYLSVTVFLAQLVCSQLVAQKIREQGKDSNSRDDK